MEGEGFNFDFSNVSVASPNGGGAFTNYNPVVGISPDFPTQLKTLQSDSYQKALGGWIQPGTHSPFVVDTGPSITYPYKNYNLADKHKTYKIINTVLKEYNKDKVKYSLTVYDDAYFVNSSNSGVIPINLSGYIFIELFNNKEEKREHIDEINKQANPLLCSCVKKFISNHIEEFLELLETEAKNDVKNTAKMESIKLEEELELSKALERLK